MDPNVISSEISKIFSVFSDMDDKYVQLIRKHHEVAKAKDKYSPQYIQKDRETTIAAVMALKKVYVESAKLTIQKIKEEYGEKPPVVEEPKTEQGKLLKEMERSNNLLLWRPQMEAATVDELRAMFLEHKWDKDFMILLDIELRKRADQLEAKRLKHEIESPEENAFFKQLNKIQIGLNSLATIEHFPVGLAAKGLENLKLRNVRQDLALVPYDDGISFRPAFKL
jgi:hypothetical protein